MSYKEKLLNNIKEKELPIKCSQQTIAYKPMSKFWKNIYQKYKIPLDNPLTLDELTNLENKLPENYGIPEDLKEYLLTFSRQISINYHTETIEKCINQFIKQHNFMMDLDHCESTNEGIARLRILTNIMYLGNLDSDREKNLGGGSLYLYLYKDEYFGTVWFECDYGDSNAFYMDLSYLLYAPTFKEFFVRFFMKDPTKYRCKNKDMEFF